MQATSSSAKRIISASTAVWCRLALTVIAQISLVPVYLSFWSADTFGLWLLLQAAWSLISVLDVSHVEYVGSKCLLIGANKSKEISKSIMSALPFSLMLSLINLILIAILFKCGIFKIILGGNLTESTYYDWTISLFLIAIASLLFSSFGNFIVKGVTVFGYYPQIAWWGLLQAALATISPIIVIYYGAGIVGASIAVFIANFIYHFLFFIFLIPLGLRVGIFQSKSSLPYGWKQVLSSFYLALAGMGEMCRQHLMRLFLSPLVGLSEMTRFSTTRTISNLTLQGLATISGPLMPELMRFIVAKDQDKTETIFGGIWVVLCIALAPATIIIQFLAPIFFPIWTRGKVELDPVLLGILSVSILVYAIAQPAFMVVRGCNLVKVQLFATLLGAFFSVAGTIFLAPYLGIRGAAISLLFSELVCSAIYIVAVNTWFCENGLCWPWEALLWPILSVITAVFSLFLLLNFSTPNQMIVLIFGLSLQGIFVIIYLYKMPPIVRKHALNFLHKFTFNFKLFN